MTAQETERIDPPLRGPGAARTASTKSSGKAYDRRIRRQQQVRGSRLTRTGSPIAAALTRVPFVALVLLLLAGGVVGVLYLNTVSDAAGLRASQSRLAQMDVEARIEADSKEIAAMKDPAHLADEARALGLVPPGDTAIIRIDADGKLTVIGNPTPVPAPTSAAVATTSPPAPPTTPQAVARTSVTAAVVPVPTKATAPKAIAPDATTPKATAPKAAAPKATAPKATAPKTTAPKTTALKTTALKATAPKSTAPKATSAGTTARATGSPQTTTTTGARP